MLNTLKVSQCRHLTCLSLFPLYSLPRPLIPTRLTHVSLSTLTSLFGHVLVWGAVNSGFFFFFFPSLVSYVVKNIIIGKESSSLDMNNAKRLYYVITLLFLFSILSTPLTSLINAYGTFLYTLTNDIREN